MHACKGPPCRPHALHDSMHPAQMHLTAPDRTACIRAGGMGMGTRIGAPDARQAYEWECVCVEVWGWGGHVLLHARCG